jgi:hypothetical protein
MYTEEPDAGRSRGDIPRWRFALAPIGDNGLTFFFRLLSKVLFDRIENEAGAIPVTFFRRALMHVSSESVRVDHFRANLF